MNTDKKAVWITGASSGIGKALAKEFVDNGNIVIGTARRIELLHSLKEELGNHQDNFIPAKLDVTKFDDVENFYKEISGDYEIKCLINNAGVTSFKLADEDTIDEVREIIEVNLLGSIYAIRSVLAGMKNRKEGTIINILSAVTQKVFTNSSIYSASKSGLMAYTKVLREELRGDNIRVINVSPGATATPIWPERVTIKKSEKMMKPERIAAFVYKAFSEESNMVPEEIVLRPSTGDL
jgi:short-subunit dehydrogenase